MTRQEVVQKLHLLADELKAAEVAVVPGLLRLLATATGWGLEQKLVQPMTERVRALIKIRRQWR